MSPENNVTYMSVTSLEYSAACEYFGILAAAELSNKSVNCLTDRLYTVSILLFYVVLVFYVVLGLGASGRVTTPRCALVTRP